MEIIPIASNIHPNSRSKPAFGHGHSHGMGALFQIDSSGEADPSSRAYGMELVAYIILCGGSRHNFIDGSVLGAAFYKSATLGVSITIALLCHEVPHELGDFGVLLSSGPSAKWDLALNCFTTVTAFLDLYIGMLALENASDSDAPPWIYAIIVGMFLYIALVNMMQGSNGHETDNFLLKFLVKNVGMLLGMLILFLLAKFEVHISL